jgi:hypothetical protein
MYCRTRDLLPSIYRRAVKNASYSVMGQFCLVDGGSPVVEIPVTILL